MSLDPVKCFVCSKAQKLNQINILLCSNCQEELLILKEELRKNDAVNKLSKDQINKVFKVSKELQIGKEVNDYNETDEMMNNDIPIPSISSIKSLSIQLNRLNNLSLNLRINSLKKSIGNIHTKVNNLSNTISETKDELEEKRTIIANEKEKLYARFEELSSALRLSIEEFKFNKIIQIEKQSIKLQFSNFKILKEIIFSKPSHNLLFYNQPIIKLNNFLSYNILIINQFLENLINLQSHLSNLFKINLPYLDELTAYLPNSSFYNLIKEKENLVVGKDDENDNEEDEKKAEEINNTREMEFDNNNERIIKLGDTIKLPLSSKTINNQRRASLIKPELNKDIPVIKERSLSPFKMSNNKKLIIIPHKLLNKPFNKLTIKEFLKFLLVLVKLLTNFKIFFTFTIDNDDINEYIYDFEKILHKICNLDFYFQNRLNHLNDLSNHLESTSLLSLLNTNENSINRLDLKILMENIYKSIMNATTTISNNSKNSPNNPPTLLQDLNLNDLIANQTKFQLDDWDIVSKIY